MEDSAAVWVKAADRMQPRQEALLGRLALTIFAATRLSNCADTQHKCRHDDSEPHRKRSPIESRRRRVKAGAGAGAQVILAAVRREPKQRQAAGERPAPPGLCRGRLAPVAAPSPRPAPDKH